MTDATLVVGRSVRSHLLASLGHPAATSSMLQVGDLLESPKSLALASREGIAAIFDPPQQILLDSGGFQWMKQGRPPLEEPQLVALYNATRPDFAMALDRPLPMLTSAEDACALIDANMMRFERMRGAVRESHVVPVLHGFSPELIERQCEAIKRIDGAPALIALGGTVPLLMELTRNFHLGRDRVRKLDLADRLVRRTRQVKSAFPASRIHILGAGGPVSVMLSIASGAHSTDSAGWRLRAGYGCVLMPFGRQVRGVARDEAAYGRLTAAIEEHWTCDCPACTTLGPRDLAHTLGKNFGVRAVHNLFQQFCDIRDVRRMLTDKAAATPPQLTDHPLLAFLAHVDREPFLKAS